MVVRKRNFSLPDDVDIALRRRAIEEDRRFSGIVVEALKDYLARKEEKKK